MSGRLFPGAGGGRWRADVTQAPDPIVRQRRTPAPPKPRPFCGVRPRRGCGNGDVRGTQRGDRAGYGDADGVTGRGSPGCLTPPVASVLMTRGKEGTASELLGGAKEPASWRPGQLEELPWLLAVSTRVHGGDCWPDHSAKLARSKSPIVE
ncbi:unnamed protein product [Rangifer tarandus platyrhynchus]|uniref:Uncharacterized protein n=1 Tax=Rangifer tarandus platyrhynchus TaxID=3082113 RepID=A0AC60A5A8_RANTA